jgi:carbamoyl-phosphate synthase large subunit
MTSPRRNVLITSAGRRTSLVVHFQRAAHRHDAQVIAADSDPLAPALLVADEAARLPLIATSRYFDALTELVTGREVGLLIPTIDTELQFLAEHRDQLAALGCLAAVSSPGLVSATGDKWLMRELFRGSGVALPRAWLPGPRHAVGGDQIPAQVFVKPRRGSAGVGAQSVAREHLGSVVASLVDPIIEEILEGLEVTVDALLGLDGTVLHYVPRLRLKTIGGESVEGVTIGHEPLASWLEAVFDRCRTYGARGPITVQLFLTERGPVLSEINPRFGGGFPLAAAAGADYAEMLLRIADGESVAPSIGSYEVGLYMTRFYSEKFLTRKLWP